MIDLKAEALYYFYLFSTKNLHALEKLFADNCVLRDWENNAEGKDDVLSVYGKIFNSVTSIAVTPAALYQDGYTVLAELLITINGKDLKNYFPLQFMQDALMKPLRTLDMAETFDVSVNVNGGGIKGQTDAITLAIARALVQDNAENKPALRAERLMTRDARVVERKKTGLRKARKREQYSKR